jgi:transposase-like protein
MSKNGDLPSTQLEFEERFSTEAACMQYLRRQRWPEGFRCPKCDGTRAWELRRRALDQCASCNHQVSLTAGTVFHGTRKPLRLWFRVIGQFLLSKSGCSALDISRQHGLNYETAWTWLHKLRSCMEQFGRALLEGDVEVDETYLGGEDDEAHKGRSLSGHKTPVAAAVEWRGEAVGRIRLIAVLNATAASLCGFVQQNVAPGAHVKTDGLPSYFHLSELGFHHQRVVLGTNPKNAIKHLPNVHRVFSLLRRWLLGTYQGAAHPIHLQSYLDEFVFRFNRRRSANRWLIFQRLLERAFSRPPTYATLIGRPPLSLVAT